MQNALTNEILKLSRRLNAREERAKKIAKRHREKYQKRTGNVAKLPSLIVPKSYPHQHFDPAHCARNAKFLARTIWKKVLDGKYEPIPARHFEVPKTTGGTRNIMSFAIPDAALANIILRRSRERNLKRLSPYSYAYHPERNVFDAILALRGFITKRKIYVVQIDFENYFDSIPTQYLEKCIDDRDRISLTPHERLIFKRFLRHKYADKKSYNSGKFSRRSIGTPQGSSISLLLANLANNDLDRALERRSGRFVRFADDVVALCSTHAEAEEIEKTFIDHCQTSGIKINERKSRGIAILNDEKGEIRHQQFFDYLGYRFTKSGLKIPDQVSNKIKNKIANLAHLYLIHYPESHGFDNARCSNITPHYDWDLLGLIQEIRNYLYGGLTEEEIRNFIGGGKKLRKMRGLMGFYALLEDRDTLKQLDGWLVFCIRLAMKKRMTILQKNYLHTGINPNSSDLILGSWLGKGAWRGQNPPDSRLPSFVRGWRAARKYFFTFGLEDVQPPRYGYY